MKSFGCLRRLSAMAAVTVVFGCGSAFAQGAATAYVPLVVNADATVKAQQGAEVVTLSVTANQESVLVLPHGITSVLGADVARKRLNAPLITGSRGSILLRLPPQPYQNVEISLHTVNGKRVLHGKASAKDAVSSVSRRNVAAGVYMLSVKGADGSDFSTRLTHGGGVMNISVAFGGESALHTPTRQPEEKADAADGDWDINVSAEGFIEKNMTIRPFIGMNEKLVINLDAIPNVPQPSVEIFADSRDGKSYKKVTIGTQTWMAQNLNYDIPNKTTDVCYGNSPDSCSKYGRLYNWATAMGLEASYNNTTWGGSDVKRQGVCPAGFHLPSNAEWTTLTDFVGGLSTAGRKLKSQSDWNSCGPVGSGKSYVCEDAYGFSALPGVIEYSDGYFYYAGYYGYWWSSTEIDAYYAWRRSMSYDYESVSNYSYNYNKASSFSVRCVQD